MQLKRGFSINKGQKIVIVEDIITTGGSVFELVNLVKEYQGEIVHIINLVDRSENGINFNIKSTSILRRVWPITINHFHPY